MGLLMRKEYYLNGERWDDGASIIARRKAEKSLPKKKHLPLPLQKALGLVGSWQLKMNSGV
jgi:hypothetical protein